MHCLRLGLLCYMPRKDCHWAINTQTIMSTTNKQGRVKVGLRPRPFLTAIIQNQSSVEDKLTDRRGTKEGHRHKGKMRVRA